MADDKKAPAAKPEAAKTEPKKPTPAPSKIHTHPIDDLVACYELSKSPAAIYKDVHQVLRSVNTLERGAQLADGADTLETKLAEKGFTDPSLVNYVKDVANARAKHEDKSASEEDKKAAYEKVGTGLANAGTEVKLNQKGEIEILKMKMQKAGAGLKDDQAEKRSSGVENEAEKKTNSPSPKK